MQYVRNIDSDEPIMMLDKHIGYDEKDGMGIDGSSFAYEMMLLDGMDKKRIQVWINSTGGSVIDGYNICNAMLKTKTKVDTYCFGIAASMAGVAFQCGRKRVMADYGILMYHNPYTSAPDGSDSGVINAMKESLNKIICQKSGMDEQSVALMMDRTTFINAEEAMNMGLCDTVESTADLNKPRMKPQMEVSNFHRQAAKVLNKLIDNQNISSFKNTKMKLVYNKLGLNEDAAESSVLAAIEGMQNKISAAEAKNQADAQAISNLKAEVETKQAELTAKEKELADAKNKLATLETEKTAAEDAKLLAEAQNMVKGFAVQGRIKNDDATIASWAEKAKNDMTGIKTLLESLPLNKAAVTIPVETKLEPGNLPTTAAALTAKVINNLKQKRG